MKRGHLSLNVVNYSLLKKLVFPKKMTWSERIAVIVVITIFGVLVVSVAFLEAIQS